MRISSIRPFYRPPSSVESACALMLTNTLKGCVLESLIHVGSDKFKLAAIDQCGRFHISQYSDGSYQELGAYEVIPDYSVQGGEFKVCLTSRLQRFTKSCTAENKSGDCIHEVITGFLNPIEVHNQYGPEYIFGIPFTYTSTGKSTKELVIGKDVETAGGIATVDGVMYTAALHAQGLSVGKPLYMQEYNHI